MAAITSPFTTTGDLAVEKNSGDPQALVSIYGTYTGLQFAFQWSPDGTNGWAPLVVRDAANGDEVSGTVSPVDNSSNGWIIPCSRIYIRMHVTAIGGGSVAVVAVSMPEGSSFGDGGGGGAGSQQITINAPAQRTEVNTAIATVGAGTLTAAAIVSGVVTRTGSTAAYTDTTDTAAAIIAALPAVTVGMSWELLIQNNVAFNETLAAGVGVTLSGAVIVPPLSTYRGLVTVVSSTAVTIKCLSLAENSPLPQTKYTSINVTTGSLAAGVATGAHNVYVLSTNAIPGAQLVRTAAQMLADTPNGAIGMSWRLVIANSGAGTLTLTTDAGATVTMVGTMTVPINTTREFIVTILTATTASVTSVGTGVYS